MKIDTDFDVLVVGAGPGGSSTAIQCAKEGLKTCLIEKRQEIGSPVRCGEGIGIDIEDIIGKKLPQNCIAQNINGAILYTPSGKRIEIDFEKNIGYILERKIFDKWLAEEAARVGVKVYAKTTALGTIKENDYVKGIKAKFIDEDITFNSKLVVAADGVESLIARSAGLKTTLKLGDVDAGFQYEMVNIELEDPNKIILYFGTKIAPRGYVWIFPKGEDKANVGIGIGGIGGYELDAKGYLDRFIQNNSKLSKGSITMVECGIIPVGGFLENMVSNGLITVGDAAHQVNPLHGGGIYEASVSGKLAGKVIGKAFKENNFSKEFLSEYNKLWWEKRGNSLKKVEKVRQVVENLNDKDLNLLGDSLKSDEIVELCSGNNLAVLGKALLREPRLLGLAKKLL